MRKPSIGTISEGTLKTEDLLQAFADELSGYQPTQHSSLLEDAWVLANHANDERDAPDQTMWEENASFIVNNLQDALNELAPPFCYFGTLEGDGACFGFWPDHEAIQDLIENSVEESVSVDADHAIQSSEHVNEDEGVRICVSDHGNIEIYSLETGETLLAIV